jgi:putative addiction module killer protein
MIEVIQSDEFKHWVGKLKDKAATMRIAARITRMALGNMGDCKPVGGGVLEARIHCGAGYRLYFVTEGKKVIVLLCGGDKSSQKKDISRAHNLAEKWRQ